MDDRAVRDQRVVHAVLEGNEELFGELVRRYQKLVAGVAWRYGVGHNEVEDVVSEVFIKAYRNLHQYRPRHPFSTWLYRLAANHVIDHGRRTHRERERGDLPEQMADPSPGQPESFEARERAQLLHAAMEEVAPRYREALFLVYVEGMKVHEAAATLGVPLGTVKTRLMRGRSALRKVLAARHPEHFGV